MDSSAQSKLANWITINKWRVWRFVDSVAILFSFSIPWAVIDAYRHTIARGFQVLDFYRSVVSGNLFLPPEYHDLMTDSKMVCAFLGLAALVVYAVLNIIVILTKDDPTAKPSWRILAFCLIVLGGLSLWYMPRLAFGDWQGSRGSLWGYWLVSLALISACTLEISCFLSERKRQ